METRLRKSSTSSSSSWAVVMVVVPADDDDPSSGSFAAARRRRVKGVSECTRLVSGSVDVDVGFSFAMQMCKGVLEGRTLACYELQEPADDAHGALGAR